MTISTERFIQFIENRLSSQDDSSLVNREVVYNAARQALQNVNKNTNRGPEPFVDPLTDAELQHAQNLEFAIEVVEARYQRFDDGRMDDFAVPLVQPRAPEIEAEVELQTDSFSNISPPPSPSFFTRFRASRKFGIVAVAFVVGLSAIAIGAFVMSGREPVAPQLFSDISSDQKFQIAGNEFTLGFEAYGDLRVDQLAPDDVARLTLPASDAPAEQISSFAFIPLEPAYATVFAGKKIRIGVIARGIGAASTRAGFTARFHSSELSLQGEFQTLTRDFTVFYFDQDIPEKTDKTSAEMIIIAAGNSPQGATIEIKDVAVYLAPSS